MALFVSWLHSQLWGLSSQCLFAFLLAFFLPFFFLVYLLWVVAIPWVTGWLTNMTMGHFRTYCLKRSWMLYIPSGSWNLTAALLPSLVPHLKWYRILCFNRFDTFFFLTWWGQHVEMLFWYQVMCRKLLLHPQTPIPSPPTLAYLSLAPSLREGWWWCEDKRWGKVQDGDGGIH